MEFAGKTIERYHSVQEVVAKEAKAFPHEVHSNVSLCDLPLDVLVQCFSLLPLSQLAVVGTLSKQISQVLNSELLWKLLCIRDHLFVGDPNLPALLQQQHHQYEHQQDMSWKAMYIEGTQLKWGDCCLRSVESGKAFHYEEGGKCAVHVEDNFLATIRSAVTFNDETEATNNTNSCSPGVYKNSNRHVFEIVIGDSGIGGYHHAVGLIDKKEPYDVVTGTYEGNHNHKPSHQWMYWSDGNLWDIAGRFLVTDTKPLYTNKEKYRKGAVIGVVLCFNTHRLTFFCNGVLAYQFKIPVGLQLYIAAYVFGSNDSVTLRLCDKAKYNDDIQYHQQHQQQQQQQEQQQTVAANSLH